MDSEKREAVRTGTYLMLVAIELGTYCADHGIYFVIENPSTSLAWEFEPMKVLCGHPSVFSVVLDYCQYGEEWRKTTKFITNCEALRPLERRCHCLKGICSATGRPHRELRGRVPAGTQGYLSVASELWTKVACPYP